MNENGMMDYGYGYPPPAYHGGGMGGLLNSPLMGYILVGVAAYLGARAAR